MNRVFTSLFILSFGAAMTVSSAVAQQNKNSNNTQMSSKESAATTMTDTHFLDKAAEGGLAEVEFGKLAEQKAGDEQVKKFGERMVTDHCKVNQQLKDVAQQEHIQIPDHLSATDQAAKDRLEKLSGAEFDHVYMKDMVKDHKADIAEFARESESAKDPAVKNFAQQTLPVLRQHLQIAEKIAPEQKTTAANTGMKHNSAQ